MATPFYRLVKHQIKHNGLSCREQINWPKR